MRIGVATGLVVVGDLLGSEEAQERGWWARPPSWQLASRRWLSQTQSSSLKVPEGLLGNLFEFEGLGPKDLKGIAGPTRA